MAELRLLTYNVRSLHDDADAVAAVIRACEPDVVAVQEAPRMMRWRSKRAALARKSGLVVATADRPGGLFVMTSMAVGVVSTRFALLPKAPKLHQRAVAAADVELRGGRWTVASVHFSLDPDERSRHLEPLLDAVAGAAAAPLVLAGDLNEEPDGPVWQSLATRFQDAYAVAPDGPAETFTARNPRRRIDAVFAEPSVEVVACHAVDGVASAGAPGLTRDLLVAASDHLPVLAVLRQ
ncbi:MAG TPA: endonuclease/exonuclease/phosphatase family protein [Mycobacteriales bacterium]|nr:endonuclease/exonuclease/phosphatase family protein [Mycobacteriales bacterium]